MRLPKFLRPRWQSDDPEKAASAVEKISNPKKLAHIALEGDSPAACVAVAKLQDQNALYRCADWGKSHAAQRDAICKLTDVDLLMKLVEHNSYGSSRCKAAFEKLLTLGRKQEVNILAARLFPKEKAVIAIKEISDQELLKEIALARDFAIAKVAISSIEDESILVSIAMEAHPINHQMVVSEAIRHIKDQKQLTYFAHHGSSQYARYNAACKLICQEELAEVYHRAPQEYNLLREGAVSAMNGEDQKLLRTIATQDQHRAVRLEAAKKLNNPSIMNAINEEIAEENREPVGLCKCSEPDIYRPAGTGWSYCRKCDQTYGRYDHNWDSMY